MVTAIQVEITNPDVISNYAKLIKALDSKDKKAQTNLTFDMEKILAKTLFRGVSITSGSGQGNPDFLVTNDGLNELLRKMTGNSADMDHFNNFVSQHYGGKGTPVEAKIMRTQNDNDIKIGIFTPSVNASNLKYFDFTSGDIIDTTRYSIVEQLRKAYQGDPDAVPPSQRELKKEIKRSDLQGFVKTTKTEFQKVVMMDPDVKKLDKLLSSSPQQKMSSAEITQLVDSINNKWAKNTLDGELSRLGKQGKLFDYITSVPALKSQFYMKSRLLSIVRSDNDKARALLLHFPMNDFNSKFFGAKFEEGQIKVFIKSPVEQMFLKQLSNETISLKMTQNMEDYDKAVSNLAATGNFKAIDVPSLNSQINYLVPTGGSIPMSTGNFFGVKRKYKRPPFYRESTDAPLAKYAAASTSMRGTFLSSEFLSLLVRKKVASTMPHGPIGGRPLRDDMLTYRTGRFANSIELLVDYRKRVVRYYYDPRYYIHEATSRNPKTLIRDSISDIMRQKFNQEFLITDSTQGVFNG